MEGTKRKRKVGGIILLCMSFLLVIVLTFTLTLAWFFDSDWSSNYVTMAGSVGIAIRDESNPSAIKPASGAGNLHFNISTDLAYPGQAIDASASVYNNGGISANRDPVANPNKGSACYIRARFIVYTNIGTPLPGVETDNEADFVNATILYQFLNGLVTTQNNLPIEDAPYFWQYYTREGGCGLSTTGTSSGDILFYLEGKSDTTKQTGRDEGYFYLCQKSGYDATNKVASTNGYMYPLQVGESSVFLWNDQFIIPWQLTNYSADKHIFVAVEFQAIQTFIPKIENGGVINSDPDNQEHSNTRTDDSDPYYVSYNNESIQTVFNSIDFRATNAFSTKITVNGEEIDFGDYASVSRPD
ncbi:MAG: hypothetical protein E7354_04830 [Clostridiales bacterium]|nr:hypothetical protein [Clostridiales bacterium]